MIKNKYTTMNDNIKTILANLSYSEFEECENPGYEEAHIIEVANNGEFMLYEVSEETNEIIECQPIDIDIIKELFPDFVLDEEKYYLIGDKNGIFY